MQFFDTHCHIQESGVNGISKDLTHEKWAKLGDLTPAALIARAKEQDVAYLMTVGCSLEDSERAVTVAQANDAVWASIGIHPHEAQAHLDTPGALEAFAKLATESKVKAVGECGLDFYYNHSPREAQEKVLRFQLELAQKHSLSLVFHVRDAFDEFWPIFDDYQGIKGVIHSFSSDENDLEQILKRGLYVGLNGIMTFTKDQKQLTAARSVPLDKLVLETDAPYLTPAPYRGTICEPKHVRVTAEFLADLRGESLEKLAEATTNNAHMLFDLAR